MSEITKIQVNGTEYDLPKTPARVSLYIDVPQNPSFPITGTLTSSQQNEIMKTSAPVIAVQVATSQSDMVETYYCYCNYLTPHCGLYGSDFYGRYDDTTLLHIKIEQNQSYTISKVSAGSGSSGVSSFGGKTGAIALSDDFKMNGNTLALKKAITSITNFVDAYNDSFDFYEKTIKFTNANYSSSGEYYYYKIEFANGFSIYGYAGGGMSIQSNDPNAAGEMYDRTIYDTASGGSLPATLELSGAAYGNSYIVSGFYGKTTDSGASYVQLTPEQFAAWIMIEFDDLKGGGGGGGTDTGFGNVHRIEYVDHSMGYYPDTKEYLVSSGRMGVYLNGSKDPINIETVQSFGIMPGNNITFTEELIDDEYKLKINATGGSSTDGFSNLKGLTLTPTTYQGADSPSGKFAFTGSGTYTLKDNSSGGIQELSFQLPVVPGDGIIFDKTTDGNCVIKAADYKPTITLETYTASQNTNHYGRVYYTFDVGNSTVATDIANGKYNVTIYDQTSGGGYYYCPLQGENMTFLGEEVPNDNNSGGPSSIVGWSFKAKESETVVSFWRDSLSLGGGGSSTYSVVEITSSTSTLTDEQYNTLTASPFNKIKLSNEIYDLYKETSAELTYTANYFNNGYQITINKSTKAVSTGSLSSLIAISAFVKNDLNYNQNNNRFALSAYQGKVLNDRLTALENGGGSPIYQHTIIYNSDKFNSMEDFSGTDQTGSFSISFYSKHGHFESPSDFWGWLIGRGAIDVSCGHLWGNIGGDEAFDQIVVAGDTDPDKYIKFVAFGGYGDWTPKQWYLKNPDATGLTDTIIDSFRDM